MSRPQVALLAARSLLAGQPSAYDASLAHHAIGIVLRDRGDLPAAIAELRKAVRLARASGRPEREVDVQATLGTALAWTGRSQQGLALLDRAVEASRGGMAGRVLMRRADVLYDLGRFHEAHQDLSRALPYLRRAGDTVWEARSLTFGPMSSSGSVSPGVPPRTSPMPRSCSPTNGQELEYAKARHNRGLVALIRGDLPEALTYFDEAGNRYDALGETIPDLAIDRCTALLAAGLAGEAAQETDTALSRIPPEGRIGVQTGGAALRRRHRRPGRRRPGRRQTAGTSGAPAVPDAGAAPLGGACQPRPRRGQICRGRAFPCLVPVRRGGRRPSRRSPERRGDAGAPARRARRSEPGNMPAADLHLERAARPRRRGPPLSRSVAWLARALQAEAQGNARATVAACARGLDALEEHQMRLGATELRAYGTAHGAELATLAQRDALRRGDVRRLLFWSERWRATALAARSAPPREDKELAAELEALRSVSRSLGETEMAASRRNALERERRRLEAAVQARTRRLPGSHKPGEGEFDLDGLFDELGPNTLIELVTVDSVLHAVVVADRRVRLHTVGSVPEREVQMNRFVLRRITGGRPQPGDELALKHRGAALEASLLGDAAAELGDGPVVVVPPGRLRAVPWTLMPSLRDRVVTVAPSASTWLRARRMRPPSPRRVALVAGPGLATKGAEVEPLRSRYPGAVLLGHGNATAGQVLTALDGAWLAHIAAHGTFRADNPMFSSILLDDGPLIVHDFERLGRAPYQLVLAGCDSGVAAPVGADELLGLVSSLIPLGAAGIVASIVPVNDIAAVPIMLALHDALQRGATLPEALLAARRAAGDDPLAEATAHSFLALGA